MSTVYVGDGTSVTAHPTATITGATNASPIRITVSAPTTYRTGQIVDIDGVAGNTAANGTFQITVVDTTHFDLDGSTGSGSYVSGGVATLQSLPLAITIPSDGDAMDAASVNVPLEAIMDLLEFLNSSSGNRKLRVTPFTFSGNYRAKTNETFALLIGCGGGAGGGRGDRGDTGDDYYSIGGSGGGGAMLTLRAVTLTPGTNYAVAIGAGGAGATVDGAAGSAGGATTFGSLAYFPGGGAGKATSGAAFTGYSGHYVMGGGPIANLIDNGGAAYAPADTSVIGALLPPQHGGYGRGYANGTAGNPSPYGLTGVYAGGAGGAVGADSGSKRGGGGGGGGGAGPFGAGGAGGAGGGANLGTLLSKGHAGTSGAANTGAGGGGGGGGAYDGISLGQGAGNGGDGGLGALYVVTFS